MKDSGDVFGVLRWGLKSYAWLVVASILLLGVLVPWQLQRLPAEYEAKAQVGPVETMNLPNIDVLPRVGQTVFGNGVVADAVRSSVRPPLPATDPVVPGRVELIAAQDNIVFTVVGRDPDPRAAEHIANVAAAHFAQELNKYDAMVGSFAIQRMAARPQEPVNNISGVMATGIGILAGLMVGVGIVALLLVWRRPVVDARGVREAIGAPPVRWVLAAEDSRQGIRGLPQLCRLLLDGTTDMLLLAGPRRARNARRALARGLTDLLCWDRSVVRYDGQETSANPPHHVEQAGSRLPFVIIDSPTQAELATRPERSLTVLVVHEGIGEAALRKEAELYIDGAPAGVVLVRGHRWRSHSPRQHLHAPRSRKSEVPRTRRPDEVRGSIASFATD